MPKNAILGATIETNNDELYMKEKISGAPLPSVRYKAMKKISWPLKFVSIEPILDFNYITFIKWIKEIQPFLVYVGYDNYDWRFPEPTLQKTLRFIEELKRFTCVMEKTIRPAWNEGQSKISNFSGLSKRGKAGEYERFKQYLHLMHSNALDLLSNLNEKDRKHVYKFFKEYYPTQKEHYWTLKKLFSLAMYIPMFLQIGISAIEKGIFDSVIYVDTHAGPGLAKVGKDNREVVLGSPLLALLWPEIIGKNLKSFKKIAKGFDKLFFVEKDIPTYKTLNGVAKRNVKFENVKVIYGNSNQLLLNIKKEIIETYEKPLILMFVDPFGKFSDQLFHKPFFEFTRDLQVDIVMNVNAPSLARGFEGKKHNVTEFERTLKDLWGDLYQAPNAGIFSELFKSYKKAWYSVRERDILDAYISRFKVDGYRFVEAVPVEFAKSKIIYYLLFASKGKQSYRWISNYMNYLRTKTPNNYDTLKKLWLQATGKLKDLQRFLS